MNTFDASASALGYLYQCRWALLAFLRRLEPGGGVDLHLEKYDDISFQTGGGTPGELIQTKHHLKSAGDLTDRSPDLWKTLRVWAEGIQKTSIQVPGTILAIVTTSKAPDSAVAALLRPAAGRDPARARERLDTIAGETSNAANRPCYDAYRRLSKPERLALVDSVVVLDNSPLITDVADEIAREVQHAAEPGQLSAFVERLEGWFFARVIALLTDSSTGPLRGAELASRISDLRRQFRPESLPIDFDDVMPPGGAKPDTDTRQFVEQLRLIAVSSRRIRQAITDYYRAFEQRSRWMREDLVNVGELPRYERRLIEAVELRRAALEDGAETVTEEEKVALGKALYTWVEQDADLRIRPEVTHEFVMRGCFHLLADEQPPRVGWHTDFITRLKTVLSPPAT